MLISHGILIVKVLLKTLKENFYTTPILRDPNWSLPFNISTSVYGSCYREKLPMAWGVPQQTAKHQKSIFPNMQEKTNI